MCVCVLVVGSRAELAGWANAQEGLGVAFNTEDQKQVINRLSPREMPSPEGSMYPCSMYFLWL